jgi:hypothetical protein
MDGFRRKPLDGGFGAFPDAERQARMSGKAVPPGSIVISSHWLIERSLAACGARAAGEHPSDRISIC